MFNTIILYCAITYLIIINIMAFTLMGVDKRSAIKNRWRISEKTLFTSAILGGSIGAIIGMRLFRHKTKHWYFVVGLPAILLVQLIAAACICFLI